jgi:hypothetical protein
LKGLKCLNSICRAISFAPDMIGTGCSALANGQEMVGRVAIVGNVGRV